MHSHSQNPFHKTKSRRGCTAHPQRGNIYGPLNGSIFISILNICIKWIWLAGSIYFFVSCLIQRNTTTLGSKLNIYPSCGPWSCFSRMRILAGDQVVESRNLSTGFMTWNEYCMGQNAKIMIMLQVSQLRWGRDDNKNI